MKLNNFGFGSGGSGGGGGTITGSGTANKLAKFTDASVVGDSQVSDNGTTVFIGASATSASALFELNSTTQGVLLPRLTTTQRNAVSVGASANSLLLYNTTTSRYQYYLNGTGWVTIPISTDIPAAPTTLYSGNGSLSSNRTVTMAGNTLTFSGNLTTFKGAGATSATSSLLVQNASGTELFRVRNDGAVISTNGYWQGTNKILYINPNGTANNTFVGEGSGNNTTTSTHNTAIGYSSLNAVTSGSYNIAIGNALENNTTGGSNIGMGFRTLTNNTSGGNNVGIGHWCLSANTTGSGNVAIGRNSLNASSIGTNNMAIGNYSLITSTTSDNTAIGVNTLSNQTTGARNTAIGTYSGNSTTTGSENIYIGYFAGQFNTIGSQNVAIGKQALRNGTTINNNTAIGHNSLVETLGDNNVAIGSFSGFYETGSNKLFIDNAQRASEADGRIKALIYGIFAATVANQRLNFNASVGIGGGVANATSVLNIANLPTSSAGLVTGDVWSDGGVLTIV